MKTSFIIAAAFFFGLATIAFAISYARIYMRSSGVLSDLSRASIAIETQSGRHVLQVEIADTERARAQGLSGRAGLSENHGMLFIYVRPSRYAFWMKDMHFPIDIVWIKNSKIVGISENVEPQPGVPLYNLAMYRPPEAVEMVLETGAGIAKKQGIQIGDRIVVE